MRDKLLVSH